MPHRDTTDRLTRIFNRPLNSAKILLITELCFQPARFCIIIRLGRLFSHPHNAAHTHTHALTGYTKSCEFSQTFWLTWAVTVLIFQGLDLKFLLQKKLAANAEETADPSAQEPRLGLNCGMFCFCNINGVKWTMERVFPLRANEEKLPHFSEDAVSPSLLPERCVSSQPHPSEQRRQD